MAKTAQARLHKELLILRYQAKLNHNFSPRHSAMADTWSPTNSYFDAYDRLLDACLIGIAREFYELEGMFRSVVATDFEIRHLFVSQGHNFFGHHQKPPGNHAVTEVDEMSCIAGKGIVGDRFFGYKPDYDGQITFFEEEVYLDLCHALGISDRGPEVFRRNVITRGIGLNNLIGAEFELQGVRLHGTEECRPCYWMNHAFGPGAESALKGRGGLRAEILSDGILRRTD